MKFVTPLLSALLGAALTLVISIGAVAGAAWYFLQPDLPSAATIRDVPLQVPLRIYSRDGRLIAQLGEQRRIPVGFDDIPVVLVQAFLAAEDDRFFEHPGFDYQGILRAGFNLLFTGQRTQGGSTITQQLARAYFLSSERSFVRKAREILLAMQIEETFTKEEILTLYMNKIFLGQRAYGVAAAAEVYFGKELADLSLAEAALIAGLPKAPSTLNPIADPVRATERRAYVLRRMRETGFIDDGTYRAALEAPVESRLHGPKVGLDAPYVAEMVRAEMVARFGQSAYTDGYRVTTTADSRLQRAADRALRTTLLEYDRRHGYRGPLDTGVLARLDPSLPEDRGLQRLLNTYPVHADLYPAVVLASGADNSATLFVHGHGRIILPWENLRWRRYVDDNTVGPSPQGASDMVSTGDVVYVLRSANQGWLLSQLPVVQGALVALDPNDGATVALAGGYDFFASKFNRAVQAKRQPGSSFKPFVYSAALEYGFNPATVINDAPIIFDGAGPQASWRPENSTGQFYGPTRFRDALARSLNLVSIRVLLQMGVGNAIRHIKPFGLPDSAMPANPTMVLGSGAVSPRDMTAGLASFANGGFRIDPYLVERIEDAGGRIIFSAEPKVVCRDCTARWAEDAVAPRSALPLEDRMGRIRAGLPDTGAGTLPGTEIPAYGDGAEMRGHAEAWRPNAAETPAFLAGDDRARRIISAENAYLMYDMMRDVIRRGTGRRALTLNRNDIAGKTGTSNDRRDAWFGGFNRDLVATAWVGFDQERSLGNREEGSRTALPMWIDFMKVALNGSPEATLPRPAGIVTARIAPGPGLFDSGGGGFELFRESDLAGMTIDQPEENTGFSTAPTVSHDEIF